jgi:hypothetical protein
MNVNRAHDYLPLPAPKPEFKELRRIMAGFIVATVICAGICAATIVRDNALHKQHPYHAASQVRCTCMGRCPRNQEADNGHTAHRHQ